MSYHTAELPLYDTWQPKFQSTDLVTVINTPTINPRDRWVVYGRMVDADHQEWYYLRPGHQNTSGLQRIRVQVDQMKRANKK